MSTPAFFAFDVETTGLDPKRDEIIQLAYQLLDGNLNLVKSGTFFVWPRNTTVSAEVAKINGYSTQKWSANKAISQVELYGQLRDMLSPHKKLIPMGHNVKFDLSFLQALFETYGEDKVYRTSLSYHSFDTVAISMFADYVLHSGLNGSYKLTHLTERYKIDHSAAHTADSDIAATVALFKTLTELLRPEGAAKLATVTPPKQWSRFFGQNTDGTWTINSGKHRGKSLDDLLKVEPDYIRWMMTSLDDLSAEQAAVLQSYMTRSLQASK
jgi:DNA polymerase III alpha subunit (gram-positive type)